MIDEINYSFNLIKSHHVHFNKKNKREFPPSTVNNNKENDSTRSSVQDLGEIFS